MTTTHTSGTADLPEALRPVELGALIASIQELNAWESRADGELLTQAEGESIILVLHELKRLIALAAGQAVAQPVRTWCDGCSLENCGGCHIPSNAAAPAQAPSQPGGFDAGDMASAAAQGYRDGWTAAQAISAEPAIPALQPVAWLVTGSYTKQAFPMHSSAVAFLKGLLSSDPDGGHKIVPLFILPQTATGDSGWEEHPANPGDTESGPEGEWYCETHPDQLMGHAGCGGAGIPACARIGMLMNQLRLTKQEVREANHMRDEMAAAALRASHGQAPASVVHLVNSAFAEIAMAFPKAFALHKVGIADKAVLEALAAPATAQAEESTKAISGTQKQAICDACGSELLEVLQSPNSYLSAEQFDADKLGDWYCKCCPKGPSKGSSTHRYFWNRDLGSTAAQAAEPVAAVVPCYTPSGKRVALYSAKQDLPIGTKLYAAPQPSPTAQADSVQEDAARLDFLIEQRAYVVSDPDACPGYWLHWARPDGRTWVQGDEHPTPRAAIDAGRKQGARWQSAVRALTLHI